LLWDGGPEQLLQLASEGGLELLTSQALLAELTGILNRPKFAQKLSEKNASAAEIVALYLQIATPIEATPLEESSLRDPDDAAVLACALAAQADLIVSGDADLQTLGRYQNIPILSAAQCLQRLGAKPAD
jgi:putative PIN family toxin of toxin-antitoxin system